MVRSAQQSSPRHHPTVITTHAAEGGATIEPGVRDALEAAYDIDLSAIRIHSGGLGDRVARSVDADAVAVGSDLFFRKGAYRPGTEEGMWLLAHEVAHAVQQAHGWVDPGSPGAAWEVAADTAADRMLAGRSAAMGRLATLPRTPRVAALQRHASWEHRLLGDSLTSDLRSLAGGGGDRSQLLAALRDYLQLWQVHPDKVTAEQITERYPAIRTMTLRASGLLVTYGELNTLPDYLSTPQAMNDLPRGILLPILQAVRQEGFFNARRLLGIDDPFIEFEGAVAMHLSNGTLNDIWESMWLADLTADLPPGQQPGSRLAGTDSYSALLARNACHFAPYSWYRWGQSYDLALAQAQEHHRTGDPGAQDAAWMFHGYADHFLQDSFAAGHLINKTLVMQWFVEWAAATWSEKVPDWVEVSTQTAARQPQISAPALYDPGRPGGVRDPQTAQEQPTREARMAMSGVAADPGNGITVDVAYQNHLIFLNSSVTQSAPLALHDAINGTGLFVGSRDRKSPFQVYGDNTMLTGGDGVVIASETAHMSQQSIQDVLDKGTSAITKDVIQSRFPTSVQTASGMLALHDWSLSLKGQAFQVFEGVHDLVLGTLNPRMGHVSQDQDRFVIQLSYKGKQGYLGRDGDNWARLVDRDHATRLRVRTVDTETYFGTEDDWWMSVGTAAGRRGYVGFYWWRHAGHPNWHYDQPTQRLSSSFYDGAGMALQDDGYIYCWADYPAADVLLPAV